MSKKANQQPHKEEGSKPADETPKEAPVEEKPAAVRPVDANVAEVLVNREALKRFVEDVRCKGISEVSDKEKVTQAELFENFLLEAKKGQGAIVTATDTHINLVIAQHLLKEGDELKVVNEGRIPVTNIADCLTAITRVGGDKKGRNIQLIYPDEENKVRLTRIGTETAWSFITEGEEKLTSLEKTDSLRHKWSPEKDCVISYSKDNIEIPWPVKVKVIPSMLRELAKDVSSFVKQGVTNLKLADGKMLFFLGDATASRKGSRDLQPITRKKLEVEMAKEERKGVEWNVVKSTKWVDAADDATPIEARYYHGLYAVIGNIDDSFTTEIHFCNILGGWMMWVHAENATARMDYMIPYDK